MKVVQKLVFAIHQKKNEFSYMPIRSLLKMPIKLQPMIRILRDNLQKVALQLIKTSQKSSFQNKKK